MVKSVLGVNHQGLREWIVQRLSAIYMAIFTIGLFSYLVIHPGLSFAEWHYLFSLEWIKIATIIFILLLVFHAWIGVWTIFTDYIKPFVARCILNTLVLLMLTACFIWAVLILWSA